MDQRTSLAKARFFIGGNMELQQIKLSEITERRILLSQLTESSSMLISFNDIALLLNREYDTVQRNISKKPSFPKPVNEEISSKDKLFLSGDVIRWIRRNTPRFK